MHPTGFVTPQQIFWLHKIVRDRPNKHFDVLIGPYLGYNCALRGFRLVKELLKQEYYVIKKRHWVGNDTTKKPYTSEILHDVAQAQSNHSGQIQPLQLS